MPPLSIIHYYVMVPILFTVFAVAVGVSVGLLKRRQRVVRTAGLEQLARQLGLTFSAKEGLGLGRQLQDFDLFERERSSWRSNGKITNVMRGHVGDTAVWMFDYSYMVSTGKTSKEVRQTVFFADDKKWYLPNFKLKPEGWWQKVLAKTGAAKDINFPENPDFSDRFWLTGGFESLIRQQFSPDIQQFLTERPPVHIEGNNYYMIAYKPGKALEGEAARIFFEHCCQLTKKLQNQEGQALFELATVESPLPTEDTALPDPATLKVLLPEEKQMPQ